ncbi:hypothetical protein B4N89_44735 [Embleya scabrispora]|uniref:Uncharacterized protein n=1 Tax=Embleya scabrispora TaxID=159449 RepID=A0A1T3NJ24_9ACTN|nr:hypothetical protein [Embleya scabrispora]OPC76601.1 hypothetical protein B4N89_44735 [Embleya scabrispora]
MDGSEAAILGAAIGAIAGLGGGWLIVLGQGHHLREQQRADRERRRDELRRDAYLACIDASQHLSTALWKLTGQLSRGAGTPTQWQAALDEAHDTWARFSATSAAVTVAGPRAVADAADTLHDALAAMHHAGTTWHSEALRAGHGRLDACNTRFKEKATAKDHPDHAFRTAARQVLDTDGHDDTSRPPQRLGHLGRRTHQTPV